MCKHANVQMIVNYFICISTHLHICTSNNVRVIGLEPTCREAPDPKSGVSTNFTTPASFTLQNRKRTAKVLFFRN